MKRIIKWHSQHLEVDPSTGKIFNPDDIEKDDYEDDMYNEYNGNPVQMQNVMSTPFGMWRIDDSMNPYRQFKLWMGHTNFSITPDVVNVIKNVPGIEVLEIMTRYRFLIGVGELFDMHNVRTTIEQKLNCNKSITDLITDVDILKQVKNLKQQLANYNQWAIYVFPNGKIDFTTSDEQNFTDRLNTYKQAVDYSNGVLIESTNEQ